MQLSHQGTSWAEVPLYEEYVSLTEGPVVLPSGTSTSSQAAQHQESMDVPQSQSLCDSASSGIWLQPRMNRRDVLSAPGHGLKLQQLPRVTQCNCGDFTSCACSHPSHRPGSCIDTLGAATALLETKTKAPSKQRNKAGLAKPDQSLIRSLLTAPQPAGLW